MEQDKRICLNCKLYLVCQYTKESFIVRYDPHNAGNKLLVKVRQRDRVKKITEFFHSHPGISLSAAKKHVDEQYDLEVPWVNIDVMCPRFGSSNDCWEDIGEYYLHQGRDL